MAENEQIMLIVTKLERVAEKLENAVTSFTDFRDESRQDRRDVWHRFNVEREKNDAELEKIRSNSAEKLTEIKKELHNVLIKIYLAVGGGTSLMIAYEAWAAWRMGR